MKEENRSYNKNKFEKVLNKKYLRKKDNKEHERLTKMGLVSAYSCRQRADLSH